MPTRYVNKWRKFVLFVIVISGLSLIYGLMVSKQWLVQRTPEMKKFRWTEKERHTHTHEKRNCLQEDSKMCRHNKYQKRNFVFVPSIFFPIEKKIKYKNIRTLILNWEDVLPRLYYKHFGWTTGEETKPIEKRIRIVLKFVSNERIDSTHI